MQLLVESRTAVVSRRSACARTTARGQVPLQVWFDAAGNAKPGKKGAWPAGTRMLSSQAQASPAPSPASSAAACRHQPHVRPGAEAVRREGRDPGIDGEGVSGCGRRQEPSEAAEDERIGGGGRWRGRGGGGGDSCCCCCCCCCYGRRRQQQLGGGQEREGGRGHGVRGAAARGDYDARATDSRTAPACATRLQQRSPKPPTTQRAGKLTQQPPPLGARRLQSHANRASRTATHARSGGRGAELPCRQC